MPTDFVLARHNMVEGQLRPSGILHPRLLGAMATLPRERFAPDQWAAVVYADEAVPLGGGRYLMEPMALARLIQLTQPSETDRALVVGAGPGYGAAILGGLVQSVVALESDPELARRAGQILPGLGGASISVVTGPLAEGHAAGAPYDVIVIEGSVPAIPESLKAQLGERGRLAAIVGGGVPGYPGRAYLGRKVGGIFSSRPVFDAGTPPLPGFERPAQFVF